MDATKEDVKSRFRWTMGLWGTIVIALYLIDPLLLQKLTGGHTLLSALCILIFSGVITKYVFILKKTNTAETIKVKKIVLYSVISSILLECLVYWLIKPIIAAPPLESATVTIMSTVMTSYILHDMLKFNMFIRNRKNDESSKK